MTAYYNEFDPQVAAWLRVLIAKGHIAPGVVDERSIEDVRPSDLDGFAQCHFFAGVGVWSYALRRAGWRDDRPIWTGSCPCQPFSAAGKGAGFDDERHLWPHFQWLIQERKPAIVLGEQVASAAVDDWIDLVHADLEALGYAFGSVPFPSAGVGAPHIRDRNYWVAHANGKQHNGSGKFGARRGIEYPDGGAVSGLADYQLQQRSRGTRSGHVPRGRDEKSAALARFNSSGVMVIDGDTGAGPTNGYWRDADWLGCRDGKWRPVEPGTFPLANGAAARVVRLRGYGNAVNAEQARAWIETVMECLA